MPADKKNIKSQALRLLGFRQQSVAEMQQKLIRKGFSRDEVLQVINELRLKGFLNDNRFAQEIVENTMRSKAVGRFYITKKLKQHGIDDGLAREVVSRIFTPEKELELCKKAADRKIEEFEVKLSSISRNQKAKLSSFLSSRGFGSDIISEILDTY